MRSIKWGIAILALTTSVACNNNKETEKTTTDSTSVMTTTQPGSMDTGTTDMQNTSGMSTSNENDMSDTGTGNTGTSMNNTSAGEERSNMNNSSGNNPSMGSRSAKAHVPAKDTGVLAKTGHYSSDASIPKPKNLDDKYLKKHQPAHTYGDTAPESAPYRY